MSEPASAGLPESVVVRHAVQLVLDLFDPALENILRS